MNLFINAISELTRIYKKDQSSEYENTSEYMDDLESIKFSILDIEDYLINKYGTFYEESEE
jgi:hypothetical protein